MMKAGFSNFRYRSGFEPAPMRSWTHVSATYPDGAVAGMAESELAAFIESHFRSEYGNDANRDDYCLVALAGGWLRAAWLSIPVLSKLREVDLGDETPNAGVMVAVDSAFAIVPLSEMATTESQDSQCLLAAGV